MHARALIHGLEQVPVLSFDFDVDAGAQQVRSARQFDRKFAHPFLQHMAGAHGRLQTPRQEGRQSRAHANGGFPNRDQPLLNNAFIGTARAKAESSCSGLSLDLGGKCCQPIKKHVVIRPATSNQRGRNGGQSCFGFRNVRRAALRFWQAQQCQQAIGLDLQETQGQRPGGGRIKPAINHQNPHKAIHRQKVTADHRATTQHGRGGKTRGIKQLIEHSLLYAPHKMQID